MYKKVTHWQKKLHALVETIYDVYGDTYDFNLQSTLINTPTDEEAKEYYNGLINTMMMSNLMGKFPVRGTELERRATDRMYKDEADGLFEPQLVLKPASEPRPRFSKEQRMPYRMMGEYVDRKKKPAKAKPKRKIVKKVVKKVKSKRE